MEAESKRQEIENKRRRRGRDGGREEVRIKRRMKKE